MQYRARRIIIFWKVKKSNAIIKKDLTICKAVLYLFEHIDNKNKVLTRKIAKSNNSNNLFYTPCTITIAINNN